MQPPPWMDLPPVIITLQLPHSLLLTNYHQFQPDIQTLSNPLCSLNMAEIATPAAHYWRVKSYSSLQYTQCPASFSLRSTSRNWYLRIASLCLELVHSSRALRVSNCAGWIYDLKLLRSSAILRIDGCGWNWNWWRLFLSRLCTHSRRLASGNYWLSWASSSQSSLYPMTPQLRVAQHTAPPQWETHRYSSFTLLYCLLLTFAWPYLHSTRFQCLIPPDCWFRRAPLGLPSRAWSFDGRHSIASAGCQQSGRRVASRFWRVWCLSGRGAVWSNA